MAKNATRINHFALSRAYVFLSADATKLQGLLSLSFDLGDKPYSFVSPLEVLKPADDNDEGAASLGLHRLAAKAQILELVDKHSSLKMEPKPTESNGEDEGEVDEAEKLKHQIVAISTNTNVISPYTSFIGVDPDQQG